MNFRQLRISQELSSGTREIISKIREVQNFVLAGQTRTGGTPQAYEITLTTPSQTYVIEYEINSATTTLETISLTRNLEISQVLVGGTPRTPVSLRLTSPFGRILVDGAANQTLNIVLNHQTSNQTRSVVIDGISGRISSQ